MGDEWETSEENDFREGGIERDGRKELESAGES